MVINQLSFNDEFLRALTPTRPSTYDISSVYTIPWPYNSLVPWSYTPCGCGNRCSTRKARVGSSYIAYNGVKYTSTMAGLCF